MTFGFGAIKGGTGKIIYKDFYQNPSPPSPSISPQTVCWSYISVVSISEWLDPMNSGGLLVENSSSQIMFLNF